MLKKLSSCTGE